MLGFDAMAKIRARAQARVGLLGNPSDLYEGRGLGFAIAELGVEVMLEDAAATALPNELFEAGWKLARPVLAQGGRDVEARPFALNYESNVPYQSGLSGSSALLIAALRAWSQWFETPLDPLRIAELAWRTEVDQLGILAGPLDRIVQARGGLLAMDFEHPFEPDSSVSLDPTLLPPMLIAWHGRSVVSSGDVHGPVFERWRSGDREVRDVMDAVAQNATEGREALETGNAVRFAACVDRNFDLRTRLFEVAPADRALIELGRSAGAAAKFPGSGGSVLFVCRDDAHLEELESLCQQDYTTLRPTVSAFVA